MLASSIGAIGSGVLSVYHVLDGLSAKLKDEPPQKRKNMAGNGEDEDICLNEDPTYGKKLEEASNTPMI